MYEIESLKIKFSDDEVKRYLNNHEKPRLFITWKANGVDKVKTVS
jgi:hypothetical protein